MLQTEHCRQRTFAEKVQASRSIGKEKWTCCGDSGLMSDHPGLYVEEVLQVLLPRIPTVATKVVHES